MRAGIVYIGKSPGVSVRNLGGERHELFCWFWILNVRMSWMRDINIGRYVWSHHSIPAVPADRDL